MWTQEHSFPQSSHQQSAFALKKAQVVVKIRKEQRKGQIAKRRIKDIDSSHFSPETAITLFPYLSAAYSPQHLQKFVGMIQSDDSSLQLEGCIAVRKILVNHQTFPIQAIINTGIISKIMLLAANESAPTMQTQAVWILANLTSGTTEQCMSIIYKGGIQLLIRLLDSATLVVVEQAIWTIANLASDNKKFRQLLIQQGLIGKMIEVTKRSVQLVSILKTMCWVVSALLCERDRSEFHQLQEMLPLLCFLLAKLVDEDYSEDISEVIGAISLITEKSRKSRKVLIEHDILPKLLQILSKSDDSSLCTNSLRVMGNIASSDYEECEYMVKCGALPQIELLLGHHDANVRKQACWVISNIAGGEQQHAQLFVGNEYLMNRLFGMVETDELSVRREVGWILLNLAYTAEKQIIFPLFKSRHVVRLFTPFLDQLQDHKSLLVGLNGFRNLFQLGSYFTQNGINPFVQQALGVIGSKFQKLLQHNNRSVYNLCTLLLQEYVEAGTYSGYQTV